MKRHKTQNLFSRVDLSFAKSLVFSFNFCLSYFFSVQAQRQRLPRWLLLPLLHKLFLGANFEADFGLVRPLDSEKALLCHLELGWVKLLALG